MGEVFLVRGLNQRLVSRDEREIRMADGRWVQVRESAVPGVGRVMLSHDVTERKNALREAAESEQRWRAIAESVPLPLVIARIEEPEVLFANQLAAEAFGLTPGYRPEAIAAVYVDPDDRLRLVERVQAEGRVDAVEVQLRRRDGRTMWALLSARELAFDGRPAMLAAATDITARRTAEQALRESEARLAAFMENAPLGMYLKDLEGRYLMANPEMSKVFRVDARAMIGRTFFDCPGGRESAPYVARCDAKVLRTGRVLVVEDQTTNPDTYRWDLVIRFPIRDETGAITHIGGFDVDISERKAMEEALKTSEQRFRVLAEAHPVPLIIVGVEDAIFRFASPACEPLFGVPVSELIGHSILPYYVDPADRWAIMAQVREKGRLDDCEVQMRRADGTPFWTAFTSRLITFEGKQAVVAAFRDLTEKKHAEAELERQREALHQSDKMTAFGSLLASVAHELNNPLSVVVGQAAMLVELAEPATAERAAKIRAAADRCARIVRTFLAMARSRPPERREVQLNEVVRSALDLAAYGLRSTGVQIDLALDPDLPPIWADGDQLHQIVANLIVNAKQAMQSCPPPRRLEIATSHDQPARALVLEVADSGPGIPPEMVERIFDPFFTTKPTGLGTGIGLSVSKRIVAAHGGEIRIAARPGGGGAQFTVRLPLAAPLAAAQAEAPAAVHMATAGGRAVLVVDDEPDVAAVLAEILRIDGLRVDVAAGGRAALARLREQDYDLVISDLRMPDLDGPGLYRELARLRPRMLERVMFVTGDTLSSDASDFLAASGAPVIDKPFDAGRVRRLAAEHLERLARAARAGARANQM
jgi:PAS domain S-box-containing protein